MPLSANLRAKRSCSLSTNGSPLGLAACRVLRANRLTAAFHATAGRPMGLATITTSGAAWHTAKRRAEEICIIGAAGVPIRFAAEWIMAAHFVTARPVRAAGRTV